MNARLLLFEINCQYLFMRMKYFFFLRLPSAQHPHPSPVARTYWRWRVTLNPFALYESVSRAIGMYQMINGAFQEALALPHPPPYGGRRRPLGRSARLLVQPPLDECGGLHYRRNGSDGRHLSIVSEARQSSGQGLRSQEEWE